MDLRAVLKNNCKNTTSVVILLVIPVTGSDLNSDFLTCIGFEPVILRCTGAIKRKLCAVMGNFDIGVVSGFNNFYGSLNYVNLGRMTLGYGESYR